MKKFFMAVIAFMMTLSASAQFYIYFSDGTVAKVDSISMVAPTGLEDPTTPSIPYQGIGTFSVSDSKQVTFSPGNLQYHPANKEWRFAESQFNYIGFDDGDILSNSDGWLDLFGWNTPFDDYSGPFVDWGTKKIGQDAPNTWRTLTMEEWDYLLCKRLNYSELCGVARVKGVNGLILLPDDWACPADVTFKSGFHSNFGVNYYAKYQTFNAYQWFKLESAGAIFLPAARSYYSPEYGPQDVGYYWSATECDEDGAYNLFFRTDKSYMEGSNRDEGCSVRLVKDL